MGKGSGSEPVAYRKYNVGSSHPGSPDRLSYGWPRCRRGGQGRVANGALSLVPGSNRAFRLVRAFRSWSDHRTITVSTCRTCYYRRFRFLTSSQHLIPPPPHHHPAINTPSRAPSRTRPVLSHVYGLMGTPPCSLCAHCYEARKQSNWGVITPDFGALTAARLSWRHTTERPTTNSLEVTTTNGSLIYLRSWKPFLFRRNQIAINIPTFERFRMFDYRPCCAYCPPTSPPF